MGTDKISQRRLDTYVFVDVSNIRMACQKTLGFHLDFVRLIQYFQERHPNLKDVRYYEGVAKGDEKKQKMLQFLGEKGYTICPLVRKSYNSVEIEEIDAKCPKCGNEWVMELSREHKAMKSNVDVYLASDMVALASQADHPTHIVIVSCDGDYAEAIKTAINLNKNISVAVLATPFVKDMRKNTLSTKLQKLTAQLPAARFMLRNVADIQDHIRHH